MMMGARDDDTVNSLAGRLARLDRQLDRMPSRERIKEQSRWRRTHLKSSVICWRLPILDRIDEKAREIESGGGSTPNRR